MKNTLSLNMIVKNEEKFLDDCLKSVVSIIDELIIADTGSTDNTKEIAKKFNASVFDYSWDNNFANARNFVLKKSSSDWILYLDADERIEPEYHKEIIKIINSNEAEAYLLKLRSKTTTGDREQSQIASYPRLFKNIPGLLFEGRIHEQITPSLVKNGARVKSTSIIIEHLGYAQNEDTVEKKKIRNLENLIKLVQEEPLNAYAYFQLGENYIALNDSDKGIANLKKAISLGSLTPPVASTAFSALAQEYLKKNDYISAEDFCIKSLDIAPNQLFAGLLLAEIYLANGKYKEAIIQFNQSIEYLNIPENERRADTAIDLDVDISFIYYKIGIAYIKLHDLEKAEGYFLKSLEHDDQLQESNIELAGIYFYKGNPETTLNCLNKIDIKRIKKIELLMNIAGFYLELGEHYLCSKVLSYVVELMPKNAKAHYFLGNCFLNLNMLEKAMEHYYISLEHAPDVFETLYNLAVIYIKQKNHVEALKIFEKLIILKPEDPDIKKKTYALRAALNK
jgi:tetratricopeptide (TPR) repeat protein